MTTEMGDRERGSERDRTRPWLLAGVFVLAIAVAVLLTLLLTRDDGDERSVGTTTSLASDPTTSVTRVAPATAGSDEDGTGPASDTDGDGDVVPPEEEEVVPPDAEVPDVTVSCSPDVMLTAVGGVIDGTAVQVVTSGCTGVAGGYAYAQMVPADPTVIADPVWVWFRSTTPPMGWAVIDYGTGVQCGDLAIPVAVCADLGV